MRRTTFIAIAALALAVTTAHANDRTPDAKLRLSAGSAAAGVGVRWGSGTLTYEGKQYPIAVKGLYVGDLGVTTIDALGKVYNLDKLSDFDGKYTLMGAGVTAGGGKEMTGMTNRKGVTVELVSTTQGVQMGLGGGRIDMMIKK